MRFLSAVIEGVMLGALLRNDRLRSFVYVWRHENRAIVDAHGSLAIVRSLHALDHRGKGGIRSIFRL